ncbi:hypothetical protein MRX96_039632 [Rhipicephalus microplus]
MGQTYVALVTFEGLKVPRYVRFYGAELHCYPHRPRQLVCKICHRLGHWADHCPTPHALICATCGTDNPAPSHPCTPHCRSCDGSHPTSDPNCPRRARQTPNKAWQAMTVSWPGAPTSSCLYSPRDPDLLVGVGAEQCGIPLLCRSNSQALRATIRADTRTGPIYVHKVRRRCTA